MNTIEESARRFFEDNRPDTTPESAKDFYLTLKEQWKRRREDARRAYDQALEDIEYGYAISMKLLKEMADENGLFDDGFYPWQNGYWSEYNE